MRTIILSMNLLLLAYADGQEDWSVVVNLKDILHDDGETDALIAWQRPGLPVSMFFKPGTPHSLPEARDGVLDEVTISGVKIRIEHY